MKKFIEGLSYAYNRNIGWQDRTIRSVIGVICLIGAIYYASINLTYSLVFGILAIAQFGTVFSAKCIICYFAGVCTIDSKEKKKLDAKGIAYKA